MRSSLAVAFVIGNLAGILSSNVLLKLSAQARDVRSFLGYQIAGNLTGFLGVLCFTGLMRYVPLRLGYGLTAGLGFILVQVVGARMFVPETISPPQWLGVALAVLGISLIGFGKQ